jgi:hypothetical protein
MEEGGPPAKRGKKQGDGEMEALSTTSTGVPQKHEISLNISGVTLGHSQALDDEMVKLREGVDASVAQARTVLHGEITKVREGMDANRNEVLAVRDEIAKLTRQLELQNNMLELQNSKLDFQTKTQNLIFAVQNTKLNSFNYCVVEYGKYNYQTGSSGDLLPLIFLCFRRGDSFLLEKQYRLVQSEYGCDSQLQS